MSEKWQSARLIPTSGISGAPEQERRAASALLAVIGAVSEFGRALTKPLGAPAGSIETFIEVPFDLAGQRFQPDGLIRVSRGTKVWTALVEVKTGKNMLEARQLEAYLDIAKEQGFQAVITISNEIQPVFGVHPTKVDKRKTKRVQLSHMSWTYVLTQAVVHKVHRGIADPDQAWILGELIRYLESPRSGAMEFEDMGESWVAARRAVSAGTLRPGDSCASDVATRWEQLIRYTSLRLGRQLGTEVQPAVTPKERENPGLRADSQLRSLVDRGVLDGGLRIPNTAGEITISADLRAHRVSASIELDAPREGRATTRLSWLIRQLKSAPDSLRIDAYVLHSRAAVTSELLGRLREDPSHLIPEGKKEFKSFRLTLSAPMGKNRGDGKGSFVGSILEVLDGFYETTVQHLKPWTAGPPKIKAAAREAEPESNGQSSPELAPESLGSPFKTSHEMWKVPANMPHEHFEFTPEHHSNGTSSEHRQPESVASASGEAKPSSSNAAGRHSPNT